MRVASSASLAATDYGGVPWHWQPPQPLARILLSIPPPIQQRVIFVCFTLTKVYVIPYLPVSYNSSQQQNQLRNFDM